MFEIALYYETICEIKSLKTSKLSWSMTSSEKNISSLRKTINTKSQIRTAKYS